MWDLKNGSNDFSDFLHDVRHQKSKKSDRAGFSGKNPVFRKIPDKWSNSRFLPIFSTLKFFKFFYIVNLDNLNCFLSFAKNRRSKKNLFRVLTTVNMRKMTFFSIFSTLIFLYCKFRQFELFFIISKKLQVQKNLFRVLTTDNMRKMTFFQL